MTRHRAAWDADTGRVRSSTNWGSLVRAQYRPLSESPLRRGSLPRQRPPVHRARKCSHRTGGLESATSGAVERARSGVRSTERVETVESEWGDGRGTQRCRRRKLQATTPGRTASDSSHRRRRGGRIGLVETFAFQSLALATALTGCAPRRPLPLSRRNSRPSPARPARTELAWLAGSGEFLELERVFGTRPPQQSPGNRGFCFHGRLCP